MNSPEDAACQDTGDVLAGGELGIIREHADRLAPDPPDTGDRPTPARAAARPQVGAGASAADGAQASGGAIGEGDDTHVGSVSGWRTGQYSQ